MSRTASGGQSAAPAPVAHLALQSARREVRRQENREFPNGANRLHESQKRIEAWLEGRWSSGA